MIAGLFWMLVANAATIVGAHALLARIRTGRGHVDLVLFLLLRLTLVSGAVLLAGLTGLLTSRALGIASAAALIGLFASGAHRRWAPIRAPRVGTWTGLFAALVALRLLAQAWYFAPYPTDAICYHLPKVAEWIRAGAMTGEMGLDRRAFFPAGFELVETWWTVFLRHDVLIEMAGIELLVLASAATLALARHVGLSERAAFSAALLYAMVPAAHLQATSSLNDGPVAAMVLATAALIAERTHPALIAMGAGLGLGIKPTYVFPLPGLALLWLLVRPAPLAPCPRPRVAIGLALAGAAIGGFWFARNTILYGSPFYPFGDEGFTNTRGTVVQQLGPSLTSLLENFRELMDSRIYDPGAYSALLSGISGWGIVAFACGLPAVLVVARSEVRMRHLLASFTLALASVFLFCAPDPWVMRFALFFPAVLMIATARLAAQQAAVGWIVAAGLCLQFAATMAPNEFPAGALRALLGQRWVERQMPEAFPIPATETIGIVGYKARATYPLYRPDFSRRIVYFRPASLPELIAAMEEEKVSILFADHGAPPIVEGVRQGRLRPFGKYFFELQ